ERRARRRQASPPLSDRASRLSCASAATCRPCGELGFRSLASSCANVNVYSRSLYVKLRLVTRRKASDPFARLRENPPQQARSRVTLTRLLDATEALLDEGGLDAATVPAIAARAGVSVGV